MPELIFVTGCNAAGKSSFIRTRMNDLPGYKIIMTDVYKSRSKDIIKKTVEEGRDIIVETVFNDASFKDLIDFAKNANYHTSIIVLFLDTVQQSIDRIAFRSLKQSGLIISNGNARINFNEGFKNIGLYFLYFDKANFLYTGITGQTSLIMSFQRSALTKYVANELLFPQNFAQFAFQNERLPESAYDIILKNIDFEIDN